MGIFDLGMLRSIKAAVEFGNSNNNISRAINRGTNLFNKYDVIEGKYLDANGAIQSHSAYTLAYIPVDINYYPTISVKTGTYCAQCDENKNIIAGSVFSGNGNTRTQTLVSGCKYLAVSTLVANIDTQCVIYGEDVTTYTDYEGATSINTNIKDGILSVDNLKPYRDYDINLLDNARWIVGKALDTSGGEITSSTSAITDFIEVNPKIGTTLNFLIRNGATSNTAIYRITLYDKNKTFISQITSASFSSPSFSITEKTAYVRFWLQNINTTYGFEGVVKYSCFPIAFFDLKAYSGGTEDNMITPDDIIPMYRFGGILASPTFVVSTEAGAAVTTYIPVKPNTRYFVHSAKEVSNANSTQARFFGRNKELISVIGNETNVGFDNVIETPYNAYFIVFSFLDSWWEKNDNTHFFGLIEANKFVSRNYGTTIGGDSKMRVAETSGAFPMGRNTILGIYEQYIAQLSFDGTKIRFSASGWDAKPYYAGSSLKSGGWKEYDIDSTTFPNYNGETIQQVCFFKTSDGSAVNGMACLVFATNNKIWYCSDVKDASALTFAEPNIWDTYGNKSWRIDGTASGNYKTDSNNKTRYKKYYPSDVASRPNQWMWHNGPVWMSVGGQYSRGLLFGNYTNASATNPTPSCLYFTENGRDIYVQYEFGATPKRYKVAGDSEVKTRTSSSINYCAGDTVDFSDTTLFPDGSAFTSLTIKKRYSIVPSASQTDPTAIFEYDEDGVAVSSVSGTSITLASVSGFAVGDIIIFEGTATGSYANLLTTSIDSTTKVGNGAAFVITAISGSTITIADIVGNPKNNLFCRHIHGVTEFGQGICIYTGEEYPESWFIYINPYMEDIANGTNANNSRWQSTAIHLNASANAYQRALGIILRPDGKCVYIADSNNPQSNKLQVRGNNINMGNFGLFVFELSDIDDNSTALTKIASVNAGYALYNLGGILFYSDYHGKTYYSEDWGDTWKYVCEDGNTKSQMIGFDGNHTRFYFGQTRGRQSIVEINP